MTEQLKLELLGEIHYGSPPCAAFAPRDRSLKWIKARILDALRRKELPPEVCGSEEGPLQPEEYDLSYLDSAVHDFDKPLFGPHDRDTLWDTIDAIKELAQEGRIIEDRYYYGSKDPGSVDYRGFKSVYRLAGDEGTEAGA